jgi:hypothetical protein
MKQVAAYSRALELSPYDVDLHDWFNGYLGVIAHPQYLDSYRGALEQQAGQRGVSHGTCPEVTSKRPRP